MKKTKHYTKTQTGIYYITANDEDEKIKPYVFSHSEINAAAQKLISGFINTKQKSKLPKK